jgi:hypothetical protein
MNWNVCYKEMYNPNNNLLKNNINMEIMFLLDTNNLYSHISLHPRPLVFTFAAMRTSNLVNVNIICTYILQYFTVIRFFCACRECNILLFTMWSFYYSCIFSDSSLIMIEKMNTELEFILRKKHVILRLLHNATVKKDSVPIPVYLHRYLCGFP